MYNNYDIPAGRLTLRFPVGAKYFSLPQNIQNHPAAFLMGKGILSQE
jgi:hypothetical protein